jgi:hypothetical protein
MSNHWSLFQELHSRKVDTRNEEAFRHLAAEGHRGRHNPRREPSPFPSEASMHQRALRQEVALMQLRQAALGGQRNAPREHTERRRPGMILVLLRNWRWGPF